MRSMFKRCAVFAIAPFFLLAGRASADVKLPAIFADHMVLQREVPVAVWGWAAAGEVVAVSAGEQTQSATAAADGKWSVKLPAMKTGAPVEIHVKGKSNEVVLHDVLVGEVWLCYGQSNMAFTVNRVDRATEEMAAAKYPTIRAFTVGRNPTREPQADCKGKWEACTPETVKTFSAAAYFFAREVQKELKVPIGLINSSFGGTDICAWTSEPVQAVVPELKAQIDTWEKNDKAYDESKAKAAFDKQMAAWKEAAAKAKADGKEAPRRPVALVRPALSQNRPSNLFNGMIAPILPFTIRGAIWYQGEANTRSEASARLYEKQLKLLISDWRTRWGSDFPFGVVQLPNISRNGTWPFLRQSELAATVDPTVGLAVTIDIGNPKDVHPTNKQDVGKRMAAWALNRVYQMEAFVPSPLPDGFDVKDGTLVVRFKFAGEGLKTTDGGEVKGFQLAGEDGKFVPAKATVKRDSVILSAPIAGKPVTVRYAWEDNPQVNLVNSAGFPASPFVMDVK